MPRFCAALASVSCLMLVVPAVETTDLPLRSSIDLMLARLLGDVAAGGQEVGVGEGDLLLALGIVGGRAAFEVDGAVGHQRNAGRRGHRIELDLELVELELLLHGVDDLVADVHREADRLLVVVEIGERDRGIAEAERDGAGVLDVLQRAGQLLGAGLADDEGRGERKADVTEMFHFFSPFRMMRPDASTSRPGLECDFRLDAGSG